MHGQGRPSGVAIGRTRPVIEDRRARGRLALLLGTALCAAFAWNAAPAFAAEEETGVAVGEVVVTAQRKQENLRDVPISVAVVGAETLRNGNYTSLTDVQFLAPSVSYNTNFGGGFQVRGVGTQSVTATIEQSVSIVVDDVVQGLPEISFAGPSYQALADIERIEVLRGPQGALFGKNSAAGVLQVITKKPVIGEVSGDTSASYGTDNETKLTLNLNVPLGPTMAGRISAFGFRRDGFVHNRYTGRDVSGYNNYGVRAKLLWQPTDKAELYVIGSHTKNRDSGNGIWTLRSCGGGLAGGLGRIFPCVEAAKLGVTAGPKNLSGAWDGKLGVIAESNAISARLTYDLGFATLKSITAYYNVDINEDVEVDNTALPTLSVNHSDFDESQFTQEVRLEGTAGMFDFTVGGFYYRTHVVYGGVQAGTFNFLPPTSTILLTSGVGGPTPCCYSVQDSVTESYAFFGQVTANVTDDLSITGGLRYTDDRNSLDNNARDLPGICQFAFALGGACKPAVGLPSPINSRTVKADDVSGKLTVKYDISDNLNVYATYATGYKGPSVSYPRGLPLVPVLPETVTSWEAGMKGSFFENRLLATLTVFRTKYKNFQGQALYLDPSNPANRAYVTTNAGGLKTSGIEFDSTFRVTPELTLTGAFAYTPTKFTEFAIPCADRFANPATRPGECTFVNPAFPGSLQFNAAGYPLVYAPKYTYSPGVNYVRPLAGDRELAVSMNYNWRDEAYTVVADPNSIMPSYGLLGANIAFGPQDRSWRVNLFARNLLDKYFVTGIFKTPVDGGSAGATPPFTIGYANIPSIESSRTVGVKLEMSF